MFLRSSAGLGGESDSFLQEEKKAGNRNSRQNRIRIDFFMLLFSQTYRHNSLPEMDILLTTFISDEGNRS